MKNVLIVEDDPMARKLLEIFVKDSSDFSLLGSIDSAGMADAFCDNNSVDLILMDVCTALDESGLDAAERIKAVHPGIFIIIITSQPECSFIDRARSIGVDSFWYKGASAEEVITVMQRTLKGDHIYPDTTPTLKLGEALSVDFTDRELEVLRELVKGDPDAVIAENLHISLRTVKAHVQSLRDKTGFRNRTELAVRARESGLVMSSHR